MKTEIKACIFDLDGVIVDTAHFHFLAWKRLADELQIHFTEHDNERLKGVSRIESLKIILSLGNVTLSEVDFQLNLDKKNTWFLEYIYQMTPADVLVGVKAFLDGLKSQNIRIALGSASKNAKLILEKIEMLPYFEAIMDGNNITEAKPNPEIFLKAAEALAILPENCVVFEDAIAGIEAAHRGGIFAVGIGKAEILTEADVVIPNFEGFSVEKLMQLAS